MTQQAQVAVQPGRPLNRAVAIVDAALNPIVQALCWILLKAGVRLVLYDRDWKSVDELAEVYNLCMGYDPNFMHEPRGSWGSLRAIPAKIDGLTSGTADSLVKIAVREFERSPDIVVDIDGSLSNEFLWAISDSCGLIGSAGLGGSGTVKGGDGSKSQIATVRPVSHLHLLMHGSCEISEECLKDVQISKSEGACPCLHAFCGSDMVAKIEGGNGSAHKFSSNRSIAVISSDDPIVFMSHIVSDGAWYPNLKFGDSQKSVIASSKPEVSLDVEGSKSEEKGEDIICTNQNSPITHLGSNEEVTELLDEELTAKKFARRSGDEINVKSPAADIVVTNTTQDGEEITSKQQALSVLDCRCQYQIVQELVRGGYQSANPLIHDYIQALRESLHNLDGRIQTTRFHSELLDDSSWTKVAQFLLAVDGKLTSKLFQYCM